MITDRQLIIAGRIIAAAAVLAFGVATYKFPPRRLESPTAYAQVASPAPEPNILTFSNSTAASFSIYSARSVTFPCQTGVRLPSQPVGSTCVDPFSGEQAIFSGRGKDWQRFELCWQDAKHCVKLAAVFNIPADDPAPGQ